MALSRGAEMGLDDQQTRELTVRSRRGLQRERIHAGELAKQILELKHQLECALHRRLRLIRVNVLPTRVIDGYFVDLRVVLHRAGTEGIEAAVDAVIELREVREVANNVRLRQLGQLRRPIPQISLRNQ